MADLAINQQARHLSGFGGGCSRDAFAHLNLVVKVGTAGSGGIDLSRDELRALRDWADGLLAREGAVDGDQ